MHLLFLDLETTGLDPDRDQILEVGWIHTVGPELSPQGSGVLRPRHRWALLGARPAVHPAVEAMHEASGLWDAIGQSAWTTPIEDIERIIVQDLRALGLQRGEAMLAGYSVHFDREFLRKAMPILHSFLSHRIVDVSTVRTLFWSTRQGKPEQAKAHRALADCEEARAELLGYLPYLQQGLNDVCIPPRRAGWDVTVSPGYSPDRPGLGGGGGFD